MLIWVTVLAVAKQRTCRKLLPYLGRRWASAREVEATSLFLLRTCDLAHLSREWQRVVNIAPLKLC